MQDILAKIKEENPKIYNYLKEDIEYYFTTNNKEKKFKNARLKLAKEELIELRNCIINNKLILNPEIIIEIKIYINKIKYKTTLEKNYNSIDEIIKNGSTKNRLKSIGITKVRDLIDFTEEEINNIEGLGITSKKIIKKALEERNIILLENPILVIEILKEENYGIIPNIMCIDQKENIKKELELLYKIRKKLQEQTTRNEEQIKKLEKKLGGIK